LLFVGCDSREVKSDSHKKPVAQKKNDLIDTSQERLPILKVDTSYLELLFLKNELVNIKTLDTSIHVFLRYADTANFLKIDFYDGLKNAYLNCDAAVFLCNAQYFLKKINPNYSLLVFDATRPQHIQKLMWDSLNMMPDIKFNYLSPPYETSLHNYGCAVDVTIIDVTTNKTLEMGTEFDSFIKLSQPINEAIYLKNGRLKKEDYDHRILLRSVMQRAGFKPIRSEWWHFSICTKEEAVAKYKLIK
jgi:D-alanyl-D-alanine dipeptidase